MLWLCVLLAWTRSCFASLTSIYVFRRNREGNKNSCRSCLAKNVRKLGNWGEKSLKRKGNLWTGRYIGIFKGQEHLESWQHPPLLFASTFLLGPCQKLPPKWGALVRVTTRRALWGQCCPLSPLAFWWHRQLRPALFSGTCSVLVEKCSNCINGVILLGQMKCQFIIDVMRWHLVLAPSHRGDDERLCVSLRGVCAFYICKGKVQYPVRYNRWNQSFGVWELFCWIFNYPITVTNIWIVVLH